MQVLFKISEFLVKKKKHSKFPSYPWMKVMVLTSSSSYSNDVKSPSHLPLLKILILNGLNWVKLESMLSAYPTLSFLWVIITSLFIHSTTHNTHTQKRKNNNNNKCHKQSFSQHLQVKKAYNFQEIWHLETRQLWQIIRTQDPTIPACVVWMITTVPRFQLHFFFLLHCILIFYSMPIYTELKVKN